MQILDLLETYKANKEKGLLTYEVEISVADEFSGLIKIQAKNEETAKRKGKRVVETWYPHVAPSNVKVLNIKALNY